MNGKVIVRINKKTGERTFEVQGVQGTKCTDITNALTQGQEILEEEFTSEYCEETISEQETQ